MNSVISPQYHQKIFLLNGSIPKQNVVIIAEVMPKFHVEYYS